MKLEFFFVTEAAISAEVFFTHSSAHALRKVRHSREGFINSSVTILRLAPSTTQLQIVEC